MVAKRQPRSPNYPVLGLKTAVDNLDKFYKSEGKNAVSREAAVGAWGYGSLNGRSLRILSACIQYGLLESRSGKVQISELGLRIQVPKSDQDRITALREAARAPKAFSEILSEYHEELPSNKELMNRLVSRGGYHNEAAETFIMALRESLEFANIQQGEMGTNQPGDIASAGDGSSPKRMEQVTLNSGILAAPHAPADSWASVSRFDLSGGTVVQIALCKEKSESSPTGDEIEELEAHFKIVLMSLRRKAGIPDPTGTTTN